MWLFVFFQRLKPELEISIWRIDRFDEIVERVTREERSLTARNERREASKMLNVPKTRPYSNSLFPNFSTFNKFKSSRKLVYKYIWPDQIINTRGIGQGTQWRPSQRYQMQTLSQWESRNGYRNINSFPSRPNFFQENRSNQNQNFNPNDNQDI